MSMYTDGHLKSREFRCQGHGDVVAVFRDMFNGCVLVEVLGYKATITAEEIAALAALFPVREDKYLGPPR